MNNSNYLTVGALLGIIAMAVVYMSFGGSPVQVSLSDSSAKGKPTADRVTGSGSPSGSHYTLNLIGVPKDKSASLTGNSGRRIFVPLEGNCRIQLGEGDFAVLDANCTDGPSSFQLPSPDADGDGKTTYSVYARALGKPGGSSTTTTCADDPVEGSEYCSIYSSIQTRTKGKSNFTNVSKELLFAYVDLDGDGNIERLPLFDDRLENYYWSYDNSGMKLLQLRFYPLATDVN